MFAFRNCCNAETEPPTEHAPIMHEKTKKQRMKLGTPVQGDIWDHLCPELDTTISIRKRAEAPYSVRLCLLCSSHDF